MDKRRRLYLRDPTVPMPKTTAWRLKKKQLESDSSTSCSIPKRRKLYYQHSSCRMPESTLQNWKKISGDAVKEATANEEGTTGEEGGNIHVAPGVSETSDERNKVDSSSDADCDEVDVQNEVDPSSDEMDSDCDEVDVQNQIDPSSNELDSDCDEVDVQNQVDPSSDEMDSDCDEDIQEDSDSSEADVSEKSSVEVDSGSDNDMDSCGTSLLPKPLYANAPISSEESVYATYLYAIKNKLSYQATSQLLDLIKIHMPSPNSCPSSFDELKRQVEGSTKVKVTHICSSCFKEVENNKQCSSARCQGSSLCHLALLPFEEHISNIFSGMCINGDVTFDVPNIFHIEKWEELQYPFSRKVCPGYIQDIHDGKLYKELQKPGGFLSIPENTGLILCADGVQLFKSSTQSFWPVLLALTSLPPGIKMNAENLVLASVWQGPVKPPMKMIINPVLDKISLLHQRGVSFQSPSGLKVGRVKLLMAVFDLPAKAPATNFVQFNGYYSCTYCMDEGVHVANRHLFLPTEKHEPRTDSSVQKNAHEAEINSRAKFGVKGRSVLSSHLNIVNDAVIDYMHAVLEGVTKSIFSTCFESKYHNYRFYLGRMTKQIDERLQRIKPPQEFRRSPRSVTSMKRWKASEHRAWLLYYCLPVLSDILPPDYIHHLSLLVSAMHILLGNMIEIDDVKKAHELLELFYKLVPQLYHRDLCTANMHSLIHLKQFVLNWGPLWGYSCFGFESMNGHLRRSCHGTRNVLPQMVHSVMMNHQLPIKCKKIASNAKHARTAEFILSFSGDKQKSQQIEIKSRIKHKQIENEVVNVLVSASIIDSPVENPSFPSCTQIRYNSAQLRHGTTEIMSFFHVSLDQHILEPQTEPSFQ